MATLAEIVLPFETRTVSFRELPGLFAVAIHPDQPEGTECVLSYMTKLVPPQEWRTEVLDEEDVALLNEIWRNLPPWDANLTQRIWHQYEAAFSSAETRPDWVPIPCWKNAVLNTTILQIATTKEYETILATAVQRGDLIVRRQLTLQPDPDATGEQLQNSIVTVDDLRAYAATFCVDVRILHVPPESSLSSYGSGPDLWTIENAAAAIANREGWGVNARDSLVARLVEAASSGTLAVRDPLTDLPYQPRELHTFYELVSTSDLDAWLKKQCVSYRLSDAAADKSPSARPPSQQRFQEEAILRVIRDLGLDPLALPSNERGKPGVKTDVRAKLGFSSAVFNKAWERLRSQRDIQDAA